MVVSDCCLSSAVFITFSMMLASCQTPGPGGLPTQSNHDCNPKDPLSMLSCREYIKNINLERIKQDILNNLGYTEPPNITETEVEELMRNGNLTISDAQEKGQKKEESTVAPPSRPRKNKKRTDEILSLPEEDMNCTEGEVLRYTLMRNNRDNVRVTNAHIMVRIWRRKTRGRKGRGSTPWVTIRLYRVDSDGSDKEFANWAVRVDKTKWHDLQLPTLMVQDVINSSNRVLKLRIKCDNCTKRTRPVLCEMHNPLNRGRRTLPAATKTKKKSRKNRVNKKRRLTQAVKNTMKDQTSRPFLWIRTKRTSRSRSIQKRDTTQCQATGKNACALKDLYVDFKELGWEKWVIAPKGYQANYCEGHCDLPSPGNYMRGQKVNEYNHRGAGTHSCCRATKMRPLTIVYLNDRSIFQTTLPNMITDSCGCV